VHASGQSWPHELIRTGVFDAHDRSALQLTTTSAAHQKAAAERRAHALNETISIIGTARSFRDIAAELTQRGVPTQRGGQWHPTSVSRLLRRMGFVPGVDISVGATQTQPLQSVNAVVTSPPYANQTQRQYGGIADADYPAWTVAWMDRVRPRLVDGAISPSSSARTSRMARSVTMCCAPGSQFVTQAGMRSKNSFG
jgi:hypothetical protein